jgi:hypothetical protein
MDTEGYYRPTMPPEVYQFGWDYGQTGVFARIYKGPEFVEKKWFRNDIEAASWLLLKSKEYEPQYRLELEQWKIKEKGIDKNINAPEAVQVAPAATPRSDEVEFAKAVMRSRKVVCDEVETPHSYQVCSTSPHHRNPRLATAPLVKGEKEGQ